MSQYEETNPHFWPTQQPGFPAPGTPRKQPRQRTDQTRPPPVPPRYQPDLIQTPPRPQSLYPELELVPPPVYQTRPPPEPPRFQPEPTTESPSTRPRPAPSPYYPQLELVPPPIYPLEPVQPPRKHPPPPALTPPRQPTQTHNTNQNLIYPSPSKTKPIIWFTAVFCIILWIMIILGGLLVLIIYLVYRPQNPHFQIMSATLNAAYLDMGYHLNADLTILANFTNPSSKVNVDFNYVILQLYYEKQLIANQYIQPFSAMRAETRLASVDMVSSQVRLPMKVSRQLIEQIQNNTIAFQVDSYIHARSNFGSIFRYSYWLYAHCKITLTGPPSGIMITSKCKTKR